MHIEFTGHNRNGAIHLLEAHKAICVGNMFLFDERKFSLLAPNPHDLAIVPQKITGDLFVAGITGQAPRFGGGVLGRDGDEICRIACILLPYFGASVGVCC